VYQTVDLAPSNPLRVYVSGSRGIAEARKGFILTSDDGGLTFRESTVALVWPDEYAPYIAGVHPTNPDILYLRTSGPAGAPARLLLSTDAGTTFTEILKFTGPMEGFALNTDGTEVWAGGTADRLHHARTVDHKFSRISDVQVQCLTWGGTELWLCSNEITGYIAGRSADLGKTFTPLLKFKDIRGPIKCPVSSIASSCVKEWPGLKSNLGIGTQSTLDGGSSGRAPDAGTSAAAGEVSGGACSASPAGAGAVTLACALALSLVATLRRQRSPRS